MFYKFQSSFTMIEKMFNYKQKKMAKRIKITPIEKRLEILREAGNFDEYRNSERKKKEPYNNQIDCAFEILTTFSNSRPRRNYVVVKGCTQSGKTGVFVSLISIIYKEKLYKDYLNINKIYYITGDNGLKVKDQTTDDINKGCAATVPEMACDGLQIEILKRSDMQKENKQKKDVVEIENAMIFIDESQCATGAFKNALPTWLTKHGLSLRNDSDLIRKNVYMISNSATPYDEAESDLAHTKQYVFYKPGNGYKGLWDFTYCPVDIKKDVFSKDIERTEKFLQLWFNHLRKIEEEKGKVKCIIARINKDYDSLYKRIIEQYFDPFEINSSNGTIDYEKMEDRISNYCLNGNGRTKFGRSRKKKKYLMIVVKGALRMGVRIDNDVKDLIGVIYDFTRSDETGIATTEQGILGRICGYRKRGTKKEPAGYKDTMVCIKKSHKDALLNFYTNLFKGNDEEYAAKTPLTRIRTAKVYEYDEKDHSKEYLKNLKKGSIEKTQWHPVGKRYDYEKRESDYYDKWAISPQEWFESKVGTDFFKGIDNFQMKMLNEPSRENNSAKYCKKFVLPFLIEQDEFYKHADLVESRRWYEEGQSGETFYSGFKKTKNIDLSRYKKRYEGEEGVNRIDEPIFKVMLDVKDISNIKICTVVGKITWGREIEKSVEIPFDKKKIIKETKDTRLAS